MHPCNQQGVVRACYQLLVLLYVWGRGDWFCGWKWFSRINSMEDMILCGKWIMRFFSDPSILVHFRESIDIIIWERFSVKVQVGRVHWNQLGRCSKKSTKTSHKFLASISLEIAQKHCNILLNQTQGISRGSNEWRFPCRPRTRFGQQGYPGHTIIML